MGTLESLGVFKVPSLVSREVRVYQPGAGQGAGPRPVLYLFDGQNVFGDEGSFAGGWHIHEAIEGLNPDEHHIPLLVGINNGGEQRMEELAPWPHDRFRGSLDLLMGWVVSTLMPRVQQRYHTLPGPLGAALGGSSMGGLASLYGHFRYPQEFGGALALSPSLWFGYPRAFEAFSNWPRPLLSRIYLDYGAREAGGNRLSLAQDMAGRLTRRGYSDSQLRFVADPEGEHRESDWRRRLPEALRFFCRR